MSDPLNPSTPSSGSDFDRNLSESYEGLAADTWDLFGGNRPGDDLEFYASVIKAGGGRALDVTCGSGKHLIPYLQRGLDVEGLDSSPTLLKSCRERGAALGLRPILYQQMMQDMALPYRYRTIFISVGSFMLLSDLNDARQTLAKCHAHLEPGGRLYVTVFRPGEATDPSQRSQQTWGPVIRPHDGAEIVIRRWTDAVDSARHIITEKRNYEVKLGGRIVQKEHAVLYMRWYELDELMSLFAEAGFMHTFAHAGFTDVAVQDGFTGEIVVRGER